MALTQITSQVISSNVITNNSIANSALETRHYSSGSITADKLAANVISAGPIASNINIVQNNVVSTQSNVNTVSSNVGAVLSNLNAFAARANANIDLVSANVSAITDTTTDLNIDAGTFYVDKSINAVGFGNTNPGLNSSLVLGSPANIVINYSTTSGGNVIIGTNVSTTPYRLDIRGTANTGVFTATSVSSGGVELRANDYATYLVAKGGLTGANTAITNLQTGLAGSNTRIAAEESNVISLQGGLTGTNAKLSANVLVFTGAFVGANTNITNLVTGLNGSNTAIASERGNVGTLQSAVLDHQANIAAIIDGTTPFTDDVTMQQSLTIQGNLTVLGSQVTVGVGSTALYDAILTLSANLNQATSPPVDSGILINRGNQDNVFIGFEGTDNHIHFVYTDSGESATTINELGHVDLHANSYHADSSSLAQPAFNKYDDLNTGIHFPLADTLSFVTGGVIRANVTSSGNLVITSGRIQAGGSVHGSLDLESPSFNNGVILGSSGNVAIFLDNNNNETDQYFGLYNNIGDPAAATKDAAIVSIRDNGDLYSKGNLNGINANLTTDVSTGNAVISASVFSNGVELRANDYATYLMIVGGLSASNTAITNLQTGLTGTNTKLSDNVAIFTGAFSGSNTRLAGAESNVIALQGGLSGANTNITNNDTDILNLQTGLGGANTYALSITSNVGLSNVAVTTAFHANDYITYTRINANLNSVSSNADAKVTKSGDTMSGNLDMGSNYITNLADPINAQDAATRAYALGLLGASIVPTYTTNTSSGTSNVIVLTNSPADINKISVALNGIVQAPDIDWIYNTGNSSIQYTDSSLPSGLVSVIQAWDTP